MPWHDACVMIRCHDKPADATQAGATMSRDIINHHQTSSSIVNHRQPSPSIDSHRHRRQPSPSIADHRQPSPSIVIRQPSSSTDRQASSSIDLPSTLYASRQIPSPFPFPCSESTLPVPGGTCPEACFLPWLTTTWLSHLLCRNTAALAALDLRCPLATSHTR